VKPSYKNEIVRNYLRRFPNTQTRTIARKIYNENSPEWSNYEACRSMVQDIRGLKGKTKLKKLANKEFVVPKNSLKNPYNLPDSEARPPKVFHLPSHLDNILFISDLHIPFHDIKALTTALDYGKKQNINCIFINGDLIDFYQISRFTNIERKRSVAEEIEITKQVLTIFNKEFPNVPIYFLKGNHDNRLEHYLANKAPELLDVEEFRLKFLLQADRFNMEVIDDTTLVKIGKLCVTHGHLLLRGIFAPVNPARGAFLRAKKSVIIGHTHKYSTHSETDLDGKIITCYSTGCLCELTPSYSPFANNYSHGFAHVKTQPNGHYSVKNIQLIDGVIIN